MSEPSRAFIDQSRLYLKGEYLPKIERCLAALSEEEVWWRANDRSNSVGNLLLHLAGNVRQWIVTGVGGAPDTRRREEEFDARGQRPKQELFDDLRRAVDEVDGVLADLDPDTLDEPRTIQGRDVTVLQAVYHVVEHFAMHTGQIIYVTKQLRDVDLAFYRVEQGVAHQQW